MPDSELEGRSMFQKVMTINNRNTARWHDLQFIVRLILMKFARPLVPVCFVCAVCNLVQTALCEP